MKSLILAAGYATRLYPLTEHTPKPLLRVKGKPMINHIVEKIGAVTEIENIYVVTNQKFYPQFQSWKKTIHASKPIVIMSDNTQTNEDRLGAVGDIHFVVEQEQINEDLLVIAGDNLFDFSVVDFVKFFKAKRNTSLAVYDTKDKALIAKKLGCLEMGAHNKLTSFEEKPEHPKTTLAATACYLFTQEDLQLLRKSMKEHLQFDNSGELISFLIKSKPVYGFTFAGKWYDIGSKEQYEAVK